MALDFNILGHTNRIYKVILILISVSVYSLFIILVPQITLHS